MFVKTKSGDFYFKTDTFWNKAKQLQSAKIYSDDDEQVERWLKSGIFPNSIYNDKVDEVIERYSDSLLGYITIDDSLLTGWSIKKDISIEDLGKPKYLYILRVKPIEEWKYDVEYIIKHDNNCYYFEDYIQVSRDTKISEILK